jgi:SOS-response transcriptional repressor LexA
MEKQPLTEVQEKIYAIVAGYFGDYGYSPTLQEIAERAGSSPQQIESHIKNIIKKGWLKNNGKRFRKIELIPK